MQLQFESWCLVCIDIICVSEMLKKFPRWSTEFSVENPMEVGMTELFKAGGQSRVARKGRKGTKHLSSDTAVLGCAVSCDTFPTWLRFPCTQDFGLLGKLLLLTSTLQSTVKATRFFSYRARCCGSGWQHLEGRILDKRSQIEKHTW